MLNRDQYIGSYNSNKSVHKIHSLAETEELSDDIYRLAYYLFKPKEGDQLVAYDFPRALTRDDIDEATLKLLTNVISSIYSIEPEKIDVTSRKLSQTNKFTLGVLSKSFDYLESDISVERDVINQILNSDLLIDKKLATSQGLHQEISVTSGLSNTLLNEYLNVKRETNALKALISL